jgi:hypothetical protein
MMHGEGVLFANNGTKYEGSFSQNKREGKGKITDGFSGNIYIGDWKQDQKSGEGYHDNVQDSRFNSCVIIAGEKFKGSYSKGIRNGVGTTTFFNGETLTCSWSDGSSLEHETFQRKVLSKDGDVFCLSCILQHRLSSQCLADVGPTISAVFTHERPLFQNCIKRALQSNFSCDMSSDRLGFPSFCSISGTGSSSVSSLSVCRPAFVISGASGPCASKVNGIFDVTEELSCGRCVCIKRDDPDVCLHFWEPSGQWLVASTDNKGKNSASWAYLKHAGELDSASSMNSWSIASHGKFANQPDVRVECLEESQCLKVLKSVPTRCALVLFVTPFVDILSRRTICTFSYSFD